MKKSIIIGTIIVFGLIGLMFWSRNNQTAGSFEFENEKKGSLSASEILYDFGTISMANGKVEKVFKITNPTDKDVLLSSVVTSCMCTTAYIKNSDGEKGPFGMPGHGGPVAKANEVIRAGESRDIRIVYDPNAHGPAGVGLIDRFIDLTEANGGMMRFEIKAIVTP
jgi:hypothetical protein